MSTEFRANVDLMKAFNSQVMLINDLSEMWQRGHCCQSTGFCDFRNGFDW